MRFRGFRRTDSNAWLEVLFTTSGDEFSTDGEAQAADLAAALAVDPSLLEVVDADEDPRTGTLIELPVDPSPRVPTTDEVIADLQAQVVALQKFTGAPLGLVKLTNPSLTPPRR